MVKGHQNLTTFGERLEVRTLAIALLIWVTLKNGSALQSPKWQLIGWANGSAAHYAAIHCQQTYHCPNEPQKASAP